MGFLTEDRYINFKGVRALFVKNYITTHRELIYPMFCQSIRSHVLRDFAAALGTVPQLQEVDWNGPPPPLGEFVDYETKWKNRKFSAIIGIQRAALQLDQVHQTSSLLGSLASRIANLPDLILYRRVLNCYGSATPSSSNNLGVLTGLDGVPFFSTYHPIRPPYTSTGAVQSNVVTGTTSTAFVLGTNLATGAMQLQNDIRAALIQMRALVDDSSQPWHEDMIKPEKLAVYCSPLLWPLFNAALNSADIDGSTNTLKDAIGKVIPTNYWPSSGANSASWMLCKIGDYRGRPFIYSMFEPIAPDQIEDRLDPNIFNNESKAENSGGITLDEARLVANIGISTNLNRQGMQADADTIMNNRFLIRADHTLEIFPGEYRNAMWVLNTV